MLNTFCGLRSLQHLSLIESLALKVSQECRVRKLLMKDRIILTFIKLKHNLTYRVLSLLFDNISAETCKSYFFETSVLAVALKPAIPFPSMQGIAKHIPTCFKPFPDVCIVYVYVVALKFTLIRREEQQ